LGEKILNRKLHIRNVKAERALVWAEVVIMKNYFYVNKENVIIAEK
jgi:hypothetical protein